MEKVESGSGYLLEPLTQRERNILAHLVSGKSIKEIANLETLAHSTVKWYLHQIYVKLQVNRRSDAINQARELGLLPTELSSQIIPVPVKNNLPRQLSSFIGREEEITQLMALVMALPLVTLTGSGGTGKTRLALEVAARVLDTFQDGTWLVSLAPLTDPELVPLVIAASLGMREIPRSSITQALIDFIGRKCLLIILDNCEHLIGVTASIASQLLHACSHLHILATSREVLRVEGEKPYRCPPLSYPDPQLNPSLTELAQSEAVRLFVERAQTVSSSFHLTESNAPMVLQVCRQLDGIPLAIELASVRVRQLSIDQIAARLDNVFHLLTGGGRTALPRHQTLQALVNWSYDLLTEKERRLLCRLSVFAGNWTLEGAEVVCVDSADTDPLTAEQILDLLGQLMDKSLVSLQDGPGGAEPRYHMLEMIRQYSHQRLLESGASELTRDRHREYYLAMAKQAETHLRGKGQRVWLERLDEELDNIRLALEWSMANNIENGLQLATALQWFWLIHGHWIEGSDWLERLLAAEAGEIAETAPETRTQAGSREQNITRARALNALGSIKIIWSENERALPLLEEARDIFQGHNDLYHRDLAISLGNLAFIEKDTDRAISGMMQALELLRKDGDNFLISDDLHILANLYFAKGDLAKARANSVECLALCREAENVDREATSLALLGCLDLISGNPLQAATLIGEAQSCYDALGNWLYSASMMDLQAHIAMTRGNYLQAIQRSKAALSISVENNSKVLMMNAISFLGWEEWALKDYDHAILHCKKGLAMARELRPNLAITAEYVLGRVALSRGEYSQADGYLKELILWMNIKNDPFRINFIWSPYGFKGMYYPTYEAINALGTLANAQHRVRRAAILFGAQDALCGWLKNTLSLAERIEFEQALALTRATLGEMAFANAWKIGQVMTREQTVSYALEDHE